MDDKDFEYLVEKALETIPEEFKEKLENVSVVVADWPSRYQLSKVGGRGFLLGLYEGVPQTRRGRYGVGGTLPDKITIFKIPILRISRSLDDVIRQVRETVIHEVGHHFGLNEKEIREAVKKRNLN
jgi:predicted Zn-dependent protease with MMP-like domain